MTIGEPRINDPIVYHTVRFLPRLSGPPDEDRSFERLDLDLGRAAAKGVNDALSSASGAPQLQREGGRDLAVFERPHAERRARVLRDVQDDIALMRREEIPA